MKTQQDRPWIPTIARLALPAGLKKATFSVGRIGFGVLLVLLATGIVYQSARANSSAQSSGYWRYVKTSIVTYDSTNFQPPMDGSKRHVYKLNVSDGAASFYDLQTFEEGEAIWQYNCTWAITSPTSLDKLNPGDTVEATGGCTDTSQYSSKGNGSEGGSMRFSLLTAPTDGKVGFFISFGYQKSEKATGKVIVPEQFSLPDIGSWKNQIALSFHVDGVGYIERMYEWVPGDAAAGGEQPPSPVTQTSAANTCKATLTPNGDITPGRVLYFIANVVDAQNNSVSPQDETWLYNGVGNKNGNMQWDGKAATVEYQYTCPLNGQKLSASYSIPPQDDASGWIVVVGGFSAVAAAGLAAVAVGAVLIKSSANKGAKSGPQPPKYILQLEGKGLGVNKNSLEVKVRENTPLTIYAHRISPDGSTVPAPEAAIQVWVPPSPAGLVVSPGLGQGSLACAFSIPKPTICADLMVAVTASAAGLTARAQVKVSIVPVYELKLEWNGVPPGRLQPGGKEVYARACLSAEPQPDAQSTPDVLAGNINLTVQGSNRELVKLQCALPSQQGPYVQKGFLWIPVTVLQPDPGTSLQPGNPTLVASFMVDGQRLEQRLVLEVNGSGVFDAWAQGKKQADVIYNDESEQPTWVFGGLRVYFQDPQDENKVIPPLCNLSQLVLQSDPADILELRNYDEAPESPDVFAGEIYLNEGVNLEQYFGSELTDKNGLITLTVVANGDNGLQYRSQPITYKLCPTVKLVAFQCENGGQQEIKGHRYTDLDLDSLEFLTDGTDELVLALFYRRTDLPLDFTRPVPFGRLQKADIQGQDSLKYQIGSKDSIIEPVADVPGLYYIRIKSKTSLLATKPRLSGELNVVAVARLVDKPPSYRIKTKDLDISSRNESLKQPIHPVFPFIKLWVVPSNVRGYSTAGAVTTIARPNRPLEIWTDSPLLKLTTDSHNFKLEANLLSRGHFFKKDGRLAESDWLQAWKLKYSELNWRLVPGAWARVYCGFDDTDSGTSEPGEVDTFELNIKENLDRMISTFMVDKDSLDLNNKEFTENIIGLELLALLRAEVRGPWYNLRNMAVTAFTFGQYQMDADHPWERYTCSGYSLRLLRYFLKRRHGTIDPEIALWMNGIEFCSYGIYVRGFGGAHSWMGFHLSGTKIDEEPIFMDPWWRQEWDDQACTDDYGYKKQNAKAIAVSALVIAEVALIAYYAWPYIKSACQYAYTEIPTLRTVVDYIKNLFLGKGKPPIPTKPSALATKGKELLDKGKELLIKGKELLDKIPPWAEKAILGGTAWIMTPIQPNPELGGLFKDDINEYYGYHEIDLFENYRNKLITNPSPSLPAKVATWPVVK